MTEKSFSETLEHVLRGDVEPILSTLEVKTIEQPTWVIPVVALARCAESVDDWESAYELWTQARRIAPEWPAIDAGVRTASQQLLKRGLPLKEQKHNVEPVVERSEKVRQFEKQLAETVDRLDAVPQSSTSATTEPAPLVTPLDFDLTEMTEPAPDSKPAESGASEKTLDDLDQLINRLQGARIIPRDDAESIPAPELEADVDDVVSETLASIYLNQEQYGEAARIFDKLAEIQPERAAEFLQKAADARTRQQS